MTTLVQGSHTIPEFYQKVYQHLSLILNKLSCMEMSNESLTNMIQSYRDKALDTFIRGLKDDLPRLLSIREPVDLPQALHLCLKLQHVDFRTQYANNSNYLVQRRPPVPPIPPRKPNLSHQNFYPQLLHYPRGPTNPFIQKQRIFPKYAPQYNHIPQFSYPPNPIPKPEPMDVDHSVRSRQINYANRPRFNQFTQKRPFPQRPFPQQPNTQPPHKFQRVFHTEPNNDETDDLVDDREPFENNDGNNYDDNYKDNYEDNYGDNYAQTFPEYLDSYDNPAYDQPEQLEDITFLD